MSVLSIKDFDDEAMRQLKMLAASKGVRPKEILGELIRAAVAGDTPGKAPRKR